MTGQHFLFFGLVWIVIGIILSVLLIFIPTPDLKGAATAVSFLLVVGVAAIALSIRLRGEQ